MHGKKFSTSVYFTSFLSSRQHLLGPEKLPVGPFSTLFHPIVLSSSVLSLTIVPSFAALPQATPAPSSFLGQHAPFVLYPPLLLSSFFFSPLLSSFCVSCHRLSPSHYPGNTQSTSYSSSRGPSSSVPGSCSPSYRDAASSLSLSPASTAACLCSSLPATIAEVRVSASVPWPSAVPSGVLERSWCPALSPKRKYLLLLSLG